MSKSIKNADVKYIKFLKKAALISLVLIFCLALCSCDIVSVTLNGMINESETLVLFDNVESAESVTSGRIEENESRETVTIDKAESIKSDNESRVTSAGEKYNGVSEVYYAVCDSVVEITTETVQTSAWMGQYISTGAGSGVVIDESGLIITNHHVIEGASAVTVRLTDGSEYEASLVGADAAADIAIIKITPCNKELTVAPLGCSADLVVGEDVVAIGNPLGSLGGTLTTGIISATERTLTIDGEEMVLLQTNAAINPGNSGGGLFNMAGQLVGIVNAKAAGDDIEGLGFAIPIDFAHKVAEDLANYGYVRGVVDHGLTLLDVTVQNLPAAYRKYGVTSTGVVILQSKYSDELKYGDYIVSVNGGDIDTSYDVELALKSFGVGDEVRVSVVRDGKIIEVGIVLQEKVPESVSFN